MAARTEALLGAHPERHGSGRLAGDVWVSADGTMVNDRGSGTHMEVKLGLVFTGAERVGKERWKLLDRHLVGATGSWTTFAERFTAATASRPSARRRWPSAAPSSAGRPASERAGRPSPRS